MASVNYDTLTIKIETDSKKADNSITKLSNNLKKLENVAQNLDIEAIKNAQKCLQDIANIDFTNVSNGLKDVVSAFKAFNNSKFLKAQQNLSGNYKDDKNYEPNFTMQDQLPDVVKPNWQTINTREIEMTPPNFTMPQDLVPDVVKKEAQDFIDVESKMIDDLKAKLRSLVDEDFANKLGSMFDNFKAGILPAIDDVSRVRNEMTRLITLEQLDNGSEDNPRLNGLKAIYSILGKIKTQAKPVQKVLDNVDKSGKERGGKGQDVGKQMGKLGKLIGAFKRVAFYRVVRRLIQIIAQAVKEGIDNIAKFDKEFNKTMSNIKSSFTYLKNAIGSAFAPFITALAPIITSILDTLANGLNKIAEIFSALNGRTTFTQAKKGAEDYAKSLSKISMGIDELNIIEQDGANFEEAQVSDEAIEKANKLKEIFEKIKGVINLFRPLISLIINSATSFIQKILPLVTPLIQSIMSFLSPILNLITMIFDKTHESVEDSLVNAVKMITQIFDTLGVIVNALMPVLVPIVNLISNIINLINDSLSTIFAYVTNIFSWLKNFEVPLTFFATILGVIVNAVASLVAYIDAIVNVFKDVLSGNWKDVGTHWNENMSKISQSWSVDFVNSIAGTSVGQSLNIPTTETPTSQNEEFSLDSVFRNYSSDMYGGTNGDNIEIKVYLDSEEIASRVEKIQDNRGARTFKGGTLTYGK